MALFRNALSANITAKDYSAPKQIPRWPQPVIPYELDDTITDPEERSAFAQAISHISDNTCIEIVPRDEDEHEDYVFVRSDRSEEGRGICNGQVGFSYGVNEMNLGEGCFVR